MLPLREAARRMGVSEESLRRRILLGEVPAVPVDDDRQYLVGDGPPAPPRRPLRRWVIAGSLLLMFLATCGTFETLSICANCASLRKAIELGPGVPLVAVFRELSPGSLTSAILEAYPECRRHEWELVWGSGTVVS